MNYIFLCNIFIIIIITLFVLITNYFFILYSNKSISLFYRKPIFLLFMSISNIIICIIHLLKALFGKKIHHLIYFNIYNIFLLSYISIYTYRGLCLIIENIKSIEIIEVVGGLFNIIQIVILFYIGYINILYYDIYFNTFDFQYFPVFFIYLVYILIINPITIYFLKKNNKKEISNEYISNTTLLSINFITEIIYFIYPNNNKYEIVKNYIQFLTFFLTYLFYIFIPLINVILENRKFKNNIYKKNPNGLEINKDIEIIKNSKKNNIDEIYIKIYETLIKNEMDRKIKY